MASPRARELTTVAAVIAVGYAAMLVAWSVTAPGLGGPAGFETANQRTFLLAEGLLVAVGATAVLSLVRRWGDGRVLPRLALSWVGTGVTVTSGPTHIALSNHGTVSLLFVSTSLAAAVFGLLLAVTGGLVAIRPSGPARACHPDR